MRPELSEHFASRKPSAIRLAQIEFMKREDSVSALNVAIGNVSLPMHPAMQKRMDGLRVSDSPFSDGSNRYTATVGLEEANKAVLNIIASSGFSTDGLYSQIVDGGSAAMELVIVGCCGAAGSSEKPLLVIDAAYTNYISFAQRLGRKIVAVRRNLTDVGKFSLPDISEIEKKIEETKPGALVVIPYDNPTGHYYSHSDLVALAKLCVKHNMWMISDEAYREMHYVRGEPTSIWGVSEKEVPGIVGRRISIETASKVWNACGLRIGALVTDNKEFHERSVAEYTANLCANSIGQYIFAGLATLSKDSMQDWYAKQREYYKNMMFSFKQEMGRLLPDCIVSSPDASIYSVVDVRNIVSSDFDSKEFVLYCAQRGAVEVEGERMTLLVAPMHGFYNVGEGEENPGRTQMRIAYVLTPEKMRHVPKLFAALLEDYKKEKG